MAQRIRPTALSVSSRAAKLARCVTQWLSNFCDTWKAETNDGHPVPILLEAVEPRRLMASIGMLNGVLGITGDSTDTKINVAYDSSSSKVTATIGSLSKSYAKSTIKSIQIVGGSKGESISVTNSLKIDTAIFANGGNDTILGGAGNDKILGGDGNDTISSRDGNDGILGQGGNDTIDGGAGSDQADAGSGTNKIVNVEVTGIYTGKVPTPISIPGSSSSSSGSTGGSTSTGGTTKPPTTGGTTTGSSGGSTSTGTTGTGKSTGGAGSTGHSTGSAVPNAVITTLESSVAVNEAIHVHGLNSQLNAGTPLTARYFWNFGDSGSKYNTLVGFNAAHIYDTPGTYTITLTLTNADGNTDTATSTVHIGGDNRRNVYVSNDGNDKNNGSSPDQAIKTVDRAIQILGNNSNIEFFFRRGDTFNMDTGIQVGGDNVRFTAYGDGDAPELNWNGKKDYIAMIWTRGTSDDVTVENLHFKTIFGGVDKTNMPDAIRVSGQNLAVRANVFEDVGYCINCNGNPEGVIAENNTVPDNTALRSYFAWVAGNDHVYLGNVVPNSTNEAILRVVDGNRVLIGYNKFTNLDQGGNDTAKNTLTIHKGSYAYIVGNVLTKGPLHIGPLGEQDGLSDKAGRWNYAVVEGNLLNTESFTLHGAQHIMYRNNISTTNGYPAYNIEGFNTTYNRGVVDATYVNNTAINNSSGGNMFVLGGKANGITIQNNLYVAPNLTPGNSQAAPLYVYGNDLSSFSSISNNVWAVGHILAYAQGGINYIWPNWSDARGYQTPAEWNSHPQVGNDIFSDTSLSGYTPSSNSQAAHAAQPVDGVFYDYNGDARPSSGSWTAGAVQV